MVKEETSLLSREQFGAAFIWGVATAAFQIEGAHDADGKGPSIWDVFSARKGKIKNGHHALEACDFYNCYKEDIHLIRQLNIPNFRFSISWPRIMPTGVSPINQSGIDYYNKIIDFLLECKIEPWITLYHWDLPHALEVKGGWANRECVGWFSEYAAVCTHYFGDRVKNWIIINEPSVFTGAGYFLGIHAPGKRGISNYLKAMHHVTLATVAGGKVVRNTVANANIGTTFSCTHIEPNSAKTKDIKAAARVDTLLNRTFVEPILGLGYPQDDLKVLKKLDRYIIGNDRENLAFDFDFIGLQCYTREIVKNSLITPYIGAALVSAKKRGVPFTTMGWEVYPPAIYHILKNFNSYKAFPKILITENGASFADTVVDGKVNDKERTQYLQNHLEQILKAKNEGCNVEGYFVWSLTDNFEWAEGYNARFGLIHIDFETQKRTIKDSGLWFGDFLAEKQLQDFSLI
ncbi:MAG: beta-glucosidase [Flavobacterium sp.]|nr:MAG: beta-glucosidase [Flavobacterium sp.]